jgi:hypothetical protein
MSRLEAFEGVDSDDDTYQVAVTKKQRRAGETLQLTDRPTGQAGILKNLLQDWSREKVDPANRCTRGCKRCSFSTKMDEILGLSQKRLRNN